MRKIALAILLLAATRSYAEESIPCRVLYRIAEGIYVDAGSEKGVAPGVTGWIERDGAVVTRVEVVDVSRNSAFLRPESTESEAFPDAGQRLVLVLDSLSLPTDPPSADSPTLRDRSAGEEFVPLLDKLDLRQYESAEPENVFHARVSVRQMFQLTTRGDQDHSITRARSAGGVERIEGTPWAVEWDGEVSYRAGSGFAISRLRDEVRLEMRKIAFYRRFEDGSIVRVGRFLPRELPGVGYLDGGQAEKVIGENFRVGTMLGLKPRRHDLDPSGDEPMAVTYGTITGGTPGDLFYSGTFGILGSLYRGTPDRLAVLVDQRLDAGPVSLYASSEVDFDVGGAEVASGTRLSRLDLHGSWAVTEDFTLRGGIDRYERPDLEAERDELVEIDVGALDPREFFLDGYWRYWFGATQRLPFALTVSGEFAYTDSALDDAIRWNLRMTRRGLPWFPDASATLAVYNLNGWLAEGYGGRLSAHFPFDGRRLVLEPAIRFRLAEQQTLGAVFFNSVEQDFTVADVSLTAHWFLSRRWSFSGGVHYAMTDDLGRISLDLGLSYRW